MRLGSGTGWNKLAGLSVKQMKEEGSTDEGQRKWMACILRGDSLLKTIMERRIEGKRMRGRPRRMLLDWMMARGLHRKE